MQEKFEKLGMVTTASVLKCTGKNWDQWVALLEKAGAARWERKEIVAFLKKKYKLSPWWQQGVTHGYELAVGRRIEGHSPSAGFALTATKTMPIPVRAVWELLLSDRGLACWLQPMGDFDFAKGVQYEAVGGVYGEVRTFKKNLRVRMTWTESDWEKHSVLQIYMVARPKGKSILIFSHEKLPNGRWRLKMREHWKKVLSELARLASV